MTVAIETIGLTKRYGHWYQRQKLLAVDHLNLAVPRGKLFGFLGPNGAGKSTTIKMLLGLIHATEGSATVLGEPITNEAVRARIGFLPEDPAFGGHLKTDEFLKLMARMLHIPRSEIKQRVEEALEFVGLTERSKSRIHEFSRGMLQRLGIAQALINRPDLVILDEPLNGLDPHGRRDLKRMFFELKSRGCTVFFSSHILSDVQDLCDHIAILNRGKLIVVGELNNLLAGHSQKNLEDYFFSIIEENNRVRD